MKTVLTLLLLLGLMMPLHSQDTLFLDRDAAIALALENNPMMRIANLEKERAQARYDELRGNLLPQLNATGSYTRNLKKQVIFFPPEMAPLFGGNAFLEIGSDNSFMGGLSMGLPLYSPALWAGIQAADTERQVAEQNHRNQLLQLQLNVQSAFYTVLLARESQQVLEMAFSDAQQQLQRARQMQQQGLVPEYDLIRAQVQTENMRPDLLQARNNYQNSISFLKTLLGLPEEQPVDVVGSLTQNAEEMLSGFNISQAERALFNNPDYINLGLQQDLLRQQTRSVRASGLPSLNAVGNYMYITESNDFKVNDFNWVNTASAGLQLSIPLFRGLTNRNQVKQLQIGMEQLQLQREYLRDNLSLELASVLKNMDVALEKAVHARNNVQLAERGHQIARLRYETGQGIQLELNDAEGALRQARFNLLMAHHELLQAKVQYDRLVGVK